MRVSPDDDIYRVRSVYHGPAETTFPWSASYPAYGVFAGVLSLIFLFIWLSPANLDGPPIFEVFYAVLITHGIMHFSNFERPVRSFPAVVFAEARAPRARPAGELVGISTRKIRVGVRQ